MPERSDEDTALSLELAALAPLLDRVRAPRPSHALVERTLLLASSELRRAPAFVPGVAASEVRLPAGFRRELVMLLVTALPAVVIGLAWAALVLRLGPEWLSAWLPAGVAFAVAALHGLAALSALGLLTAGLPLVAHRRALFRLRGATE